MLLGRYLVSGACWAAVCSLVVASARAQQAPVVEQTQTPTQAPAEPPAVDAQAAAEPGADVAAAQPGVAAEAEAVADPVEDAQAEAAQDAPEDDIVVTGSRLKRSSSFDAPSPVQVVDREAMARTGASTIKDLVANMPVNFGGQNNAGLGTGTGVRGAAIFDLHGLGPSTTLVLVNGRRLLRTGLTIDGQQFDNAAQIPMTFVERVEIMKGGASAIYGSDAVSGVVNIITRRRYTGAEVQVGGGLATQPGGLREGEVSLTLGAASDKGAIAVNATYFNRTELRATDRPYSLGDPDKARWPFPQPVPTAAFPEGYATPTLSSGAGSPGNFALTPNPGMGPALRPDPGCGSAPGSYLRAGRCNFLFTPYYHYVYPEDRLNVYSTMEHDLSDHVVAFAEFGYMRLAIENSISPSYVLNREIVVPLDHPDIPVEWRADIDQAVAAAQAMGGNARLQFAPPGSRTRGGDYPAMMLDTLSEGFRGVVGVRGDLAGVAEGTPLQDWDWELSGTYQRNLFLDSQPDDITENLQRALNACTPTLTVPDVTGAPAAIPNPDYGAIPCFHPFYAQRDLNLYDRNNRSGATVTEYIMGQAIGRTDSSMWVGDALLRGPIVRLPGGDLSIALGAQVRHERLDYRSDHDSNRRAYASIGGTPNYAGSRDIWAVYGELSAPVIEGLELQAALRHEAYRDVGQASTDPKVGLSWAPFKRSGVPALAGTLVRAGYATSFRGPSLFQSYGRLVALQEFAESSGTSFRPVSTTGTLYLTPERSRAINAGLEWSLGGVRIEADYWHVTYQDIIVKDNPVARWTACRSALEMGADAGTAPACRGVTLANGSLASIDVPFINASSSRAHGLDLNAALRLGDAGALPGALSLGASASYLLSYRLRPSAAAPEVEAAGRRNVDNFAPSLPRLRMSLPIGWSLGGHALQATGILVGSYVDDQNPQRVMNMPVPGTEPRIPAWFTLNLQYGFRTSALVGKPTGFTVGATNVLDADPPFVQTNLGYDTTVHDPRGRMLFARLSQEF